MGPLLDVICTLNNAVSPRLCVVQCTFNISFLTMLSSSIVLATALASISAGLVNAQATSASARASTSEPSAAISSNTATAPSSTYSESDVPTGTPLPGNYAGPLRPQVHFSPPVGFMNDPNGMFVDQDGLYHLYYQCKLSEPQSNVLEVSLYCVRQSYRRGSRESTLGPRHE